MKAVKKNEYLTLSWFFFFLIHSPIQHKLTQGTTMYQVLEWRKPYKVPVMMTISDFTLHGGLDQCLDILW